MYIHTRLQPLPPRKEHFYCEVYYSNANHNYSYLALLKKCPID